MKNGQRSIQCRTDAARTSDKTTDRFLGGLHPQNPLIPLDFGHIRMCPKYKRLMSDNHAAIVRLKIECLSGNVGIYDKYDRGCEEGQDTGCHCEGFFPPGQGLHHCRWLHHIGAWPHWGIVTIGYEKIALSGEIDSSFVCAIIRILVYIWKGWTVPCWSETGSF